VRRILFIAAPVALFIILLASLPARTLGLIVPGDQVHLKGFAGTLWRGSAARAVLVTGQGLVHLGELRWRLHPSSLLLLSPKVTLSSRWGDQRFSGVVQTGLGGDITLRDVEADASADLVKHVAPLALQGRISLQLSELTLRSQQPVSGSGRVVWQRGAWQAPQGLMPLGSYALDFSQQENAPLTGDVVTLSGPIEANGQVSLLARDYTIDLLITGQQLDQQLEQALSLLAPREGEGFRLKWQGQLQ
jgi:hypothetical protein